jgi:hypothetical protein
LFEKKARAGEGEVFFTALRGKRIRFQIKTNKEVDLDDTENYR